jgi:flagellar basal body-associated protein FliL
MKHRIAYNLLLSALLICAIIAWFLAGFGVGVQMTPNPTAQLEQNIASVLIVFSIIGLITINVVADLRRRK